MDRTFAEVASRYRDWEATMREATPCRDCGTTGGWAKTVRDLPTRRRGLCNACYRRHDWYGTLGDYPLVGNNRPPHPEPLPERVELVAPRQLLPWGGPATAEWQQATDWEARRAAAWLAAHGLPRGGDR